MLVPFLPASHWPVGLRGLAGAGVVFLAAPWHHGYRHQRFQDAEADLLLDTTIRDNLAHCGRAVEVRLLARR